MTGKMAERRHVLHQMDRSVSTAHIAFCCCVAIHLVLHSHHHDTLFLIQPRFNDWTIKSVGPGTYLHVAGHRPLRFENYPGTITNYWNGIILQREMLATKETHLSVASRPSKVRV